MPFEGSPDEIAGGAEKNEAGALGSWGDRARYRNGDFLSVETADQRHKLHMTRGLTAAKWG